MDAPVKRLADLLGPPAPEAALRVQGPREIAIAGLATDTRALRPGFLFAALAGRATDGHRFIPQAVAGGAAAILAEPGRAAAVPAGVALVETPDVRGVLGAMADRFYDHPSAELELVGVTGTNGKTTVTYLLEAVFRAAGRAPGVIGTIELRWGGEAHAAPNTTPEAVDLQRILRAMVAGGVQVAALEASSHALELRRLAGCRFRTAIFTNLGRDHLDFHPDLEAYFAAKARLFTEFAPASSVVNTDDPWGRRLAAVARGTVISYGFGPEAACRALRVTLDGGGLRFVIAAGGEEVEIRSPLVGRHNVFNILAAAAAARAHGVPWQAIRAGVAAMALVPGRFERVSADGEPTVLVDFAHTPEAVENAVRGARELTRGRLVVVFGCGGDRDRGKRPLMGRAAVRLADEVYVTSDNPRSEEPGAIIDEILAGARAEPAARAAVHVVPDRRAAIRAAVGGAAPADLVLIAGKGHEDYQILGARTVHFSDREEARAALEERRCRAS
jgi:UDP-N-acetylmuramoyl-L-alanyl-D-glutamate--2,6-diaminopimelate ligase